LKSLEPFLALRAKSPTRAAESKLYRLPHELLFAIFAIVEGGQFVSPQSAE